MSPPPGMCRDEVRAVNQSPEGGSYAHTGFGDLAVGAQTYDPHFPVCLQSYSLGGGKIDCSYTSLAQCNASASGRGAQCLTNPFFALAYRESPSRGYRRQYR
jgi:hypothetical protein